MHTNEIEGAHLSLSIANPEIFKNFPSGKIQKTANVFGMELKTTEDGENLDIWVPYTSKEIVLLAKEMKIKI